MAKDTEKLIRQLSLISFLMANGRPVSALEIKREVEGYCSMNEDAFARRFYADRAELESLGITLQVEKPSEGFFEAELYALPPENYYLRPIEFTDGELAALRTALALLDGEFAYAEPLRLALQQVSWGRPSPLTEGDGAPIDVRLADPSSGREVSQRLAKIETAISRRKTIEFTYYSLQRDELSDRKVDPYHLVFRDGQFYLIGHSHERDEVRVFRLSPDRGQGLLRDQGRARLLAPRELRPPRLRDARRLADGLDPGHREGLPERAHRLAGRARLRQLRDLPQGGQGRRRPRRGHIFETDYASGRQLVSWVLGWRENASLLEPSELATDTPERRGAAAQPPQRRLRAAPRWSRGRCRTRTGAGRSNGRSESVIRPERFARLVSLAGLLIGAAREGAQAADRRRSSTSSTSRSRSCRRTSRSSTSSTSAAAPTCSTRRSSATRSRSTPTPTATTSPSPARLLPLEAKALVAAIDLFGDHLPAVGAADGAREDRRRARPRPLRGGPRDRPRARDDSEVVRTVHEAIEQHRVLELHYYKENEDEFTERRVEPYKLASGPEGWYLGCFDPAARTPATSASTG